MKISIIDYYVGNTESVANAFSHLGHQAEITNKLESLFASDLIVLPGVGSFELGITNLRRLNLIKPIRELALEKKRPLLGICLGMQLLASESLEGGLFEGLDVIPGKVTLIEPEAQKIRVPHVGWNDLAFKQESRLFQGVPQGECFYFDHSYEFVTSDEFASSIVKYGKPIVASVEHENIFGVQFHPEKSQKAGLSLLRNVLNYAQNSLS